MVKKGEDPEMNPTWNPKSKDAPRNTNAEENKRRGDAIEKNIGAKGKDKK
jgi:hypothetical protein